MYDALRCVGAVLGIVVICLELHSAYHHLRSQIATKDKVTVPDRK